MATRVKPTTQVAALKNYLSSIKGTGTLADRTQLTTLAGDAVDKKELAVFKQADSYNNKVVAQQTKTATKQNAANAKAQAKADKAAAKATAKAAKKGYETYTIPDSLLQQQPVLQPGIYGQGINPASGGINGPTYVGYDDSTLTERGASAITVDGSLTGVTRGTDTAGVLNPSGSSSSSSSIGPKTKIWLGVGGVVFVCGYLMYNKVTWPISYAQKVVKTGHLFFSSVKGY